jgi:hypothetical protein
MSHVQIMARIQGLVRFQPPAIGERVSVDTSADIELDDLVGKILRALDGNESCRIEG